MLCFISQIFYYGYDLQNKGTEQISNKVIWKIFYLYYEEENFSKILLLKTTDGKLSKMIYYNLEMVQSQVTSALIV